MSAAADTQNLAPGTVVTLYTIDHSDAGGALLRFTPGTADGGGFRVAVIFGGHTYLPLPVELTGVEAGVSGQSARPTLTISAVDAAASIAILGTDNLRGARITRTRTLAKYLDGEPQADPTRTFGEEIWRIEKIASRGKTEIEWQLASALDFDSAQLPARQALRDVCAWEYRRHSPHFDPPGSPSLQLFVYSDDDVGCPYRGTRYYDSDDNPTADPAKDQCSRRLSGCRLRFEHADQLWTALHFGGFPGLGVSAER